MFLYIYNIDWLTPLFTQGSPISSDNYCYQLEPFNKQNNTWMFGNYLDYLFGLFLVLNRISHSFALLTRERSRSTLEINFIFPHIHVLFSYFLLSHATLSDERNTLRWAFPLSTGFSSLNLLFLSQLAFLAPSLGCSRVLNHLIKVVLWDISKMMVTWPPWLVTESTMPPLLRKRKLALPWDLVRLLPKLLPVSFFHVLGSAGDRGW